MKFDKAIEGFLIANSTDLSARTISLYRACLLKFCEFIGNPELTSITRDDPGSFLHYLQTEYIPKRPRPDTLPLAPSTVDKYWIAIRSFFSWAEETQGLKRPDKEMKRPKYDDPEIIPFTEAEITKILYAFSWTQVAANAGKKAFRMKRPTAERDKAIVLTFLDTGMRIGELLRLKYKDINLELGEIYIRPFSTGVKSKPRTVFLGRAAKKAVWAFISKREDWYPDDRLFGVNVKSIQSMFFRAAVKTGIHVHAHRFRHTFAIQYLRNGGDVFTLKRLLGHSSLKMVMHYLHMADNDAQNMHRTASPADRWRL